MSLFLNIFATHCTIKKKHGRFSDDFAKLQAEHNQKFNNSGTETYKVKKRSIETPEVQPTKIEPCADVTGTTVADNSDYTLIIDKEALYIKAKQDAVVPVTVPLVLGFGEYHTDGKEHKNSLVWKMDTMKYEAWFIKDTTEGKMTLEEFLKQLENEKIVQPFIAAHELDYTNGSVACKPTEPCVFEIKKLATNMEVTSQNGLSQLMKNIKLDTWEYSSGTLLRLLMRLKFIEQSSNPAGIYPQKPGLFLKAPLAIQQGKTYKIG